MSTRSRSAALNVLALVASDFAYRPGKASKGTSLQSYPDNEPGDEFEFPGWLYRDLNTSALTGAVLDDSRADGISVVRLTEWEYVDTIEDSGDGFGAVFFRSKTPGAAGKYEYILAFRGTDGRDKQDWFANLDLGMNVWNDHRAAILSLLTTRDLDTNRAPSDGIIHFTGQSLGGGLAQYAAYDYANELELSDDKEQLASRMTLTTFNGFGGVRGLVGFYKEAFKPSLLEYVSTAHYFVDNDLVHRLGAGKPEKLYDLGGSWHLNGAGKTYQLNFVKHDSDGIAQPGPQNKLGIIEGHRIESGFYQGFERHRTNFQFATSASIRYIDTDQSQSVGAAFSRVFNRGFTTSASATYRLVAGLLAIGVAGSRTEVFRLTREVTTALYLSGMNKTWKYIIDMGAPGLLLLAANSKPGNTSYVASIGIAALMEAFGSSPGDRDAVRTAANSFLPSDRQIAAEVIQPTSDMFAAPTPMLRLWQLMLVHISSLPKEEVSELVTDQKALAFIEQVRQAGVDPERFADEVTRRGDWFAYSKDFLREKWLSAHAADPGREVHYAAYNIALAESLEGLAEAVGSGDGTLLAEVKAVLKELLVDLGKTLERLPFDIISSANASTADIGTNTLKYEDFRRVVDVVTEAARDSDATTVRELLADTLATLKQAGQSIVIRAGAAANAFDAVGIAPDLFPASAAGVAEGHARLFTLYLPYEAGKGGQHVNLQLKGAAAPTFKAILGSQVVDLAGGEFDLLVAEGQRQVSFGLWSREDVDEDGTLTLVAQLVDDTGTATHLEHIELELSLDAVDEQPFTIPTLVLVDPNPDTPAIYGTDADELILGKDSDDIVYPELGADFVLTGAGDDQVIVRGPLAFENAADWVDLGDGNDFAMTSFGEDTLLGGFGSDFMCGGADGDRLYAFEEINLNVALEQGETQDPGASRDLLDGWSGNDTLIGWSGADGLLGGDGEDVLVGMGGDDNIFGDWQFSEYTTALADWHIERTVTWPTPERRKFTAKLVSAYMTEQDVAGGADTVFAGAGADWVFAQAGDDFVDGGRGDDVIFGDAGADALYGRDGADWIAGDEADDGTADGLPGALHGADTLDGGAGDDEMSGNGGDDQLYGGDGDDSLGGDDTLTPGEFHGKDYLVGGTGNDKLWGEGNDDWLVGGDGDDHLEGDESTLEARFHGADHLDGGAGADELIGQGGADELYGGDGDDSMAGDNADDETLAAAFHGDDFLDGGAGNDSLKGGGGKDRLFGGDGEDVLLGDGGDVEGDDELHGGAGGDTLVGNGGKDRLYGDAGQDFLDGGAGDDLLQGGADLDRLEGGEGDDVYVLYAGDSPAGGALESIADSGGRDTIRLVGASVTEVRQNGDTPDLVLSFGSDDEVLIENGFAGSIESFEIGDGIVLSWQDLLGRYLDEVQDSFSADAGAMLAGGGGGRRSDRNGRWRDPRRWRRRRRSHRFGREQHVPLSVGRRHGHHPRHGRPAGRAEPRPLRRRDHARRPPARGRCAADRRRLGPARPHPDPGVRPG